MDFFILGWISLLYAVAISCSFIWLTGHLHLPKPLAKTFITEKEQWELKFPKVVISSTKTASTFLTRSSCIYPRACIFVPQLQGRLWSWIQCYSLHLGSPEGCLQSCPWNRLIHPDNWYSPLVFFLPSSMHSPPCQVLGLGAERTCIFQWLRHVFNRRNVLEDKVLYLPY